MTFRSRARVAVLAVATAGACGALAAACKSPSEGGRAAPTPAPASSPGDSSESLYDLSVRRLDGAPVPLSSYRGKVALLVNVASECGFTPQYEGLETLYEELAPRGFVILGFPSNDFGAQEPGSPNDIAAFAASTYHVTFPLFEKVATSGDAASPVYSLATRAFGPPKWNFHKYLIDRRGHVVAAFPSAVTPGSDKLRDAIRAALDAT